MRPAHWMLDDVVVPSWAATPKPPSFLRSLRDGITTGDATAVQVHDRRPRGALGGPRRAPPPAINVHTLGRAPLTGELLRYRITAWTRPRDAFLASVGGPGTCWPTRPRLR